MDKWLPARQFYPKKPPIYSTQEQCPHCGSDQVRVTTAYYDRARQQIVSDDTRPAVTLGVLTWALATLLLYGALPFFSNSSSASGAVPFWVPLVLGIAVFMALTVRREWRVTRAARMTLFTCEHCHQTWLATRPRHTA